MALPLPLSSWLKVGGTSIALCLPYLIWQALLSEACEDDVSPPLLIWQVLLSEACEREHSSWLKVGGGTSIARGLPSLIWQALLSEACTHEHSSWLKVGHEHGSWPALPQYGRCSRMSPASTSMARGSR